MTDQTAAFTPPAAEGLPPGVLDSATDGASALDAWAREPVGRNFLAHALVQLARDGWLRTEPGEGFETVRDRETPEPEDAPSAVPAPATDQAAAPTDWIDGHTQLEAIAAAVWEQCERSDSGLVIDDPRNIAVAALAALLPAPAEPPLSPDYEHPACGFHWHGRDGMDIPMRDGQPVCPRCELRRLADEAQQPEAEAEAAPDARPGTTDYTLVQRSGLLRRSEAAAAQQPKEARP
jgi:hypothetical protein